MSDGTHTDVVGSITSISHDSTPVQKVTIDLKTAVAAICVVAAGVASTIGGIYSIGANIRSEMRQLDDRWQDRILKVQSIIEYDISNVESEFKSEFKELKANISPPKVEYRLSNLEERVKYLEGRHNND